ncbi:MAG: HD domain-containing protein [Deferribacteres bacterium]|nr:HD domain-containing protein [candidate division KSB1 bacterium]MCB9509532.1 HD domain-containing protein [Deferribacteres bacterium]
MNKTRSKHIKLSLPSPYLKSRGNWQNFLLAQLDSYTRIHSLRVGRVAAKIGELLNLKSEDRLHIATAGLFHDIGKLMIDRDILYKQNPLSKDEMHTLQSHPELGAKIWLKAGGYYRISEAILCHHENYDGSGYPLGLARQDIPLWGRIIAVADALDAMLSARPYREPFTLPQTLQAILDSNGTRFDPFLLDRLHKGLRDTGFLHFFRHYKSIFSR